MKFSLGVAALATAVVTTAALLVAAVIEPDTAWETNPFIAFVGALLITVYANNALTKGRTPSNPQRAVTMMSIIVLIIVLVPTWLGGRGLGYQLQMTAQFVALAVCLIGLLPPLARAAGTESNDSSA